jgi:hypothetical protein
MEENNGWPRGEEEEEGDGLCPHLASHLELFFLVCFSFSSQFSEKKINCNN